MSSIETVESLENAFHVGLMARVRMGIEVVREFIAQGRADEAGDAARSLVNRWNHLRRYRDENIRDKVRWLRIDRGVVSWWDRHSRNYITYCVDQFGYQNGAAEFSGERDGQRFDQEYVAKGILRGEYD